MRDLLLILYFLKCEHVKKTTKFDAEIQLLHADIRVNSLFYEFRDTKTHDTHLL